MCRVVPLLRQRGWLADWHHTVPDRAVVPVDRVVTSGLSGSWRGSSRAGLRSCQMP
jgi:hypothetical protein